MREQRKEQSKERRNSFFQHFILRRRTVSSAGGASYSERQVNLSGEEDERHNLESPTSKRDEVPATTGAGSVKPTSRLQRASSMIRRGTRRFRDEPLATDLFSYRQAQALVDADNKQPTSSSEKDSSVGISEGSERRNWSTILGRDRQKRQSLDLKGHTHVEHRPFKGDGMFGRGEPGYFIKELKRGGSISSTSKRMALRTRQQETLTELKEQLRNASAEWMHEFVREPLMGGAVLLDLFEEKLPKHQTGVDLSVQATSLECLRSLASSAPGLAMLLNATATKKIACLISSRDVEIRVLALELLSFVCLSPPRGVPLVLEAINHHQQVFREPARFHNLVQALMVEEKSISFLINSLFFINSLVNTPEELKTRIELRREFVNLGLLKVVSTFKDTWALSSSELKTQIKVFEEEMQHDDQIKKRAGSAGVNVDRGKPEEMFNMLFMQVRDSPYCQSFNNTLSNMLQLCSTIAGFVPLIRICSLPLELTKGSVHSTHPRQQAWQALEAMVSQYISFADREGACEVEVMPLQDFEELKLKHDRKVRNLHNRVRRAQAETGEVKEQLENLRIEMREERKMRLKEGISKSLTGGLGEDSGRTGGATFASTNSQQKNALQDALRSDGKKEEEDHITPATSTSSEPGGKEVTSAPCLPLPIVPDIPPPPPGVLPPDPPPPRIGSLFGEKLPQKRTVHPAVKLKHLNWTKIPAAMVARSLWAEIDDERVDLDQAELERLFAATAPTKQKSSHDPPHGNLSLNSHVRLCSSAESQPGRATAKPTLITLIDIKRANNCAIMLSSFRSSYREIRDAIIRLDDTVLDHDKIVKLLDCVPTKEELDLIADYPEDKSKLGKAEQFFWEIRDIRHYGERLKAWAFKLKCRENLDELRPDIIAVIESCEEVRRSKKFKAVMGVVLAVGNYINGGTHRGAAHGFKLEALTKLRDIKSCDNHTSLLHYVVHLISHQSPELLSFPKELKHVPQACRVSIQIIKTAVDQIRKGFNQVKQTIASLSSGNESEANFIQAMHLLLETNEGDFQDLQSDFKEMEDIFEQTIEYFGEPISSTPEQLFGMIQSFIHTFERASEENHRLVEKKTRTKSGQNKETNNPIDDVVSQLRSGALFRKRREAIENDHPI